MHQPLKHHIFEDSSMVVTSSSTWSAGGITLNFRKKKIISHRIADDNILTFKIQVQKNLIRFFILTNVCENEQQGHKNEYKESNC